MCEFAIFCGGEVVRDGEVQFSREVSWIHLSASSYQGLSFGAEGGWNGGSRSMNHPDGLWGEQD